MNALKALSKKLKHKVRELRNPQTCWKYTTNNESITNLSRLSLAILTVKQKTTRHSRHKDILPCYQKQDAKEESLANTQSHLAIIAEDSPPKLPQVMNLIEETAKVQFSLKESAAEPADMIIESLSNQNKKQREISSGQPLSLRPLRNDDHGKHNRRDHQKEGSRSYY